MEPFQKDALMHFFRAAGQPDRLKMLGLIANRPYTAAELAQLLQMKETLVDRHLHRLLEAGLVRQQIEGFSASYQLRSDYLEDLNQVIVAGEEFDDFETRVLRKYLKNDRGRKRLRTIPRDEQERQVILQWIADDFEVGQRYTEAKVTAIISRHFHKQEMLRRYLLDKRLLKRTGDVYWRPEST